MTTECKHEGPLHKVGTMFAGMKVTCPTCHSWSMLAGHLPEPSDDEWRERLRAPPTEFFLAKLEKRALALMIPKPADEKLPCPYCNGTLGIHDYGCSWGDLLDEARKLT